MELSCKAPGQCFELAILGGAIQIKRHRRTYIYLFISLFNSFLLLPLFFLGPQEGVAVLCAGQLLCSDAGRMSVGFLSLPCQRIRGRQGEAEGAGGGRLF